MTFNPNIPQPTDFLATSQQDILTNFQTANTSQSVNHFPFNDTTADNGKHKFLQMPESAAPVTAADEGGVYCKVGAAPAETNLWLRGENNGFEYQLTSLDSSATASFAANTSAINTSGWTFLPGGLVLQYGYRKVSAKGTATTVTFPKSFNTAVFCITIGSVTDEGPSPSPNNQFVFQSSIALTGFTLVNSSGSSSRRTYWMALGI